MGKILHIIVIKRNVTNMIQKVTKNDTQCNKYDTNLTERLTTQKNGLFMRFKDMLFIVKYMLALIKCIL